MSKDCIPAPRRQAVLIAVHADGFLEAFAERNLDVAFARIPAASNQASERLAEDCFEQMLPLRYRELWRADLLRACGSTAPLRVETIQAALAAKDCVAALEPFMPPKPKKKRGAA